MKIEAPDAIGIRGRACAASDSNPCGRHCSEVNTNVVAASAPQERRCNGFGVDQHSMTFTARPPRDVSL